MCHEILVAHATFLHDGLSVVEDESRHNAQSDVQLTLVDETGAQEKIHETEEGHVAHDAQQEATQE